MSKATHHQVEEVGHVLVRASTGTYLSTWQGMLGLSSDVAKATIFATQGEALTRAESIKTGMDKRWKDRGRKHPYGDLVVKLLTKVTTFTVQ